MMFNSSRTAGKNWMSWVVAFLDFPTVIKILWTAPKVFLSFVLNCPLGFTGRKDLPRIFMVFLNKYEIISLFVADWNVKSLYDQHALYLPPQLAKAVLPCCASWLVKWEFCPGSHSSCQLPAASLCLNRTTGLAQHFPHQFQWKSPSSNLAWPILPHYHCVWRCQCY